MHSRLQVRKRPSSGTATGYMAPPRRAPNVEAETMAVSPPRLPDPFPPAPGSLPAPGIPPHPRTGRGRRVRRAPAAPWCDARGRGVAGGSEGVRAVLLSRVPPPRLSRPFLLPVEKQKTDRRCFLFFPLFIFLFFLLCFFSGVLRGCFVSGVGFCFFLGAFLTSHRRPLSPCDTVHRPRSLDICFVHSEHGGLGPVGGSGGAWEHGRYEHA